MNDYLTARTVATTPSVGTTNTALSYAGGRTKPKAGESSDYDDHYSYPFFDEDTTFIMHYADRIRRNHCS